MRKAEKEARADGLKKAMPKSPTLRGQILEVLGDRQMTIWDLAAEMYQRGMISKPERQYIAPRVNELKKANIIQVASEGPGIKNGRRISPYTRVRVTVYERSK